MNTLSKKLVTCSFGLLLACSSFAQIAPPSQSVKKRHLQTSTLSWDYAPIPDFTLLYFSVKMAYDLNQQPQEFKQVPAGVLNTSFPTVFTPQFPKYVYYVVTSVTQGKNGRAESFNSRTVMAERIGPPPQ